MSTFPTITPPSPPQGHWAHLSAIVGALVSVAVGIVDLKVAGGHLGAAADSALILGGLAGLGVKGSWSR